MFHNRRRLKEKYGDDAKFADRRNKLEVEKGDLPAMMIAAFITLVLPVVFILCVIYGVIWLIFLR